MTSQYHNSDVVTSNVSSDVSRVTGRVKWFNNKAGYGFITVSDGPHTGDVFVHHSAINVNQEQYRYLVQGEYVEFECVPVEGGPHQWQAANVTGPQSGPMMCETRRVVRSTRPPQTSNVQDFSATREQGWQQHQYRRQPRLSDEQSQEAHTSRRHHQQTRVPRHPGSLRHTPREGDDQYEWLLVRKYPQGTRPPVRRVRRPVATVDSQ